MSAQRVTLTPDAEAALVWRMPPENQGQIIEIDYAADEDYVYERSHDRSSRRTSFRRRPWRASDETYIGLNRVPAGFDTRVRARRPKVSATSTVRYRVVQTHNGGILSRHRTLDAARKGRDKAARALQRWANASHGGHRNVMVGVTILDAEGRVVE